MTDPAWTRKPAGVTVHGAACSPVPRTGGLCVVFMHELHTVRGRKEDDFEAAFRDGWMPMLGAGDDAR